MVVIAKGLTEHCIMFVTMKQDRATVMKNFFDKQGLKSITCLSLYEALQSAAKDMPHVIVTESILSDGNANDLYDRLRQDHMLKKIPILVQVTRSNKTEISEMTKRKFAGFFAANVEAGPFFAKIKETLTVGNQVSPFFVPIETTELKRDVTISLDGLIVGQTEEQVVSKSSFEIDSRASILCVPADKKYGPSVLRLASNMSITTHMYNLFPINKVVGKGKMWMSELPKIKLIEDNPKTKKMIFCDPSEERFIQFKEILNGYGIESVYASSLPKVTAMVKQRSEDFGCVYLYEVIVGGASAEWKAMYGKLPMDHRPGVIAGTTAMNARSTSELRYIKRPFGIGPFLEMINASFEKAGEIDQGVKKSGFLGVPVKFQAPAKLLGLDESGGIIELRFPIQKGSKLSLEHDFLMDFLGKETIVTVSAIAPSEEASDSWHVRFHSVAKDVSKSKYWLKLSKALEERLANLRKQLLNGEAPTPPASNDHSDHVVA